MNKFIKNHKKKCLLVGAPARGVIFSNVCNLRSYSKNLGCVDDTKEKNGKYFLENVGSFNAMAEVAYYDGDNQAWVDDCAPGRDNQKQANGGAGTFPPGTYPGVGIECQGFNKKKAHSMAQYDGDSQAWVDDCAPGRDNQ